MLNLNFLCSNTIFVSTAHNNLLLKKYFKNLDKIFNKIKQCEDGNNIKKLLKGPVVKNSFRRLN